MENEPNAGSPSEPPAADHAPVPEPASSSVPSPAPEGAGAVETNKDACLWGMLCHLTALSGLVGIPFGNILGPLIVWLMKKKESPFVDAQGKEALNFQITMMIYGLVSAVLCLVIIGFLLLFALLIMDLVCVIMASVKANNGMSYRYPLTIRFLK
jgi:uncharacterized Tic20 family protein